MAMATDIAEFLGAALGLNLLFHVPLLPAGFMTGAIAFGILELQRHGHRRFELAITALLGLIFLGFLYETLKIGPSASSSLRDTFIPHLAGSSSIYLAVGIIGATVMPHAIYLHSALTQGRTPVRDEGERRRVLGFERVDVLVALGFAGLINLAMLAVAAKLFHTPALSGLHTIQQAHAEFGHLVGGTAALAFAVALLASGASSSSVGTYAGQVVMAGFVNLSIPLVVRRAVTMIPALVVLAIGASPTSTLVLSQVVLSFGIPFALVPARAADAESRRHGLLRERAPHERGRHRRVRTHRGPERLPARLPVRPVEIDRPPRGRRPASSGDDLRNLSSKQ